VDELGDEDVHRVDIGSQRPTRVLVVGTPHRLGCCPFVEFRADREHELLNGDPLVEGRKAFSVCIITWPLHEGDYVSTLSRS
jgi:hypothetical protein